MVENSWWMVTVASSNLSIIGGLFIIYTYGAISKIQNSTRELLVYLTIADIATAYGNLVGAIRFYIIDHENQTSREDFLCTAQSFVTTFSSLSSFIWTSLIAVNVFVLFINGNDVYKSSTVVRLLFHTGGWIFPGIVSIIALSLGKLGLDPKVSGGWCWISGNLGTTDKIVWMFLTGKSLELLTYLVTSTLYILLKWLTWRRRKSDPNFDWSSITNHLRKEDENFCLAWMVLYVARIWGTIRLFMSILMDEHNVTAEKADNVLKYLHSYGDSAQAFWNCVLYCLFDKTVRNHVFVRFRKGHSDDMEKNPSLEDINERASG